MREVHFRAWIYDNLNKCGAMYYAKDFGGSEAKLLSFFENRCKQGEDYLMQSIIVEGKEFYEGDVVKNDTGDIGVVRFGKLPLDKSGDCVCTYPAFYIHWFGQLGQAPAYECSEIGEWMEIIGTIHTTHPELLKQ